jgi:CheY-like chemotaxis protein
MDGRCTILVVDDDKDLRALLQDVLEREGHVVLTARDGVEALARVRGLFGRVVALVDLQMPGMGGEDFVRAMKGDPVTAAIPIVVCTGTRGARVPGAAAVIEKPFSIDSVLEAVKTHSRCDRALP